MNLLQLDIDLGQELVHCAANLIEFFESNFRFFAFVLLNILGHNFLSDDALLDNVVPLLVFFIEGVEFSCIFDWVF